MGTSNVLSAMLTTTVYVACSHRRRPILQAQPCFGHGNRCFWKQHRWGLPANHVLETYSHGKVRMVNACGRSDPAGLLCHRHSHLPTCTTQDQARVAEAPSKLQGLPRHPLRMPLCRRSHLKPWSLCAILLHRYVKIAYEFV